MIRTTTSPTSEYVRIKIPKDWIDHKIVIHIVPVDEQIGHDPLVNDELMAFTEHSVTTIEDWYDEEEDRIWV